MPGHVAQVGGSISEVAVGRLGRAAAAARLRRRVAAILCAFTLGACDTGPTEGGDGLSGRNRLQFAGVSDTAHALAGDTVVADVVILDADGVPRDTTGLSLQWSVSNPRVLEMIRAPLFLARDSGAARITVTWGALRGELPVRVRLRGPAEPGSIDFGDVPSAIAAVGDTILSDLRVLDEFGAPRSADGLPITWGSTNTNIVRSVRPGVWVAAGAGTASLRARLYNFEALRGVQVLASRPALAEFSLGADSTIVLRGGGVILSPILRDALGNDLPPSLYPVAYQSSNPALLTVNNVGVVTAIATGRAIIRATTGHLRDSIHVTVMSGVPLSTGTILTIYDGSPNLNVGDSTQLRLTTEVNGTMSFWGGAADEWESLTPEIARISSTGMLTALAPGTALIRAYFRGLTDTDERIVMSSDGAYADLTSVSVGAFISCGTRRAGGALLCWGDNADAYRGQIVERTPPNGYVDARVGRNTTICGITLDRRLECADGSQSPPGIRWRTASLNLDGFTAARAPKACGLSADSTGVCWYGGDSLTRPHGTSKLHSFAYTGETAATDGRVCSVDLEGVARCNDLSGAASTPTIVAGLPSVLEVGIGAGFECYRTASGDVWCRGSNIYGQLGTGTTSFQSNPVKVGGGLPPMAALAVASNRSCGLSQAGDAWCWNGLPFAVTNANGAISVSTGVAHSCALKADGSAWCWGYNSTSGLGDLTYVDSPRVAKRVRGPTAP